MLTAEQPTGPTQREACALHDGDPERPCRSCGHPHERHPQWLDLGQLAMLGLTAAGD